MWFITHVGPNLWSLCLTSWQSRQVSRSQVSQNSFSSSCLWMPQNIGFWVDHPWISAKKMCILFIYSVLPEWTLSNDLEKYVKELRVPFETSSLLVMVWSLVNLTLRWATTQVPHRYSTQFRQNPTASVLSLQGMQIWGREQKRITFRCWLVI